MVIEDADSLRVTFLEDGGQRAEDVAGKLADFIASARRTIDLAVYDCNLSEGPAAILKTALTERLRAGVRVRVVYDAGDKPQTAEGIDHTGAEPAPIMSHERLAELGLPNSSIRAISNSRALMHHKFVVVDDSHVWTGSMNLSDDSMQRMENIVLTCSSADLGRDFARVFEQLWTSGRVEDSGAFATSAHALTFAGRPAPTDVDFSPGQGEAINELIASRIADAQSRIVVCSMLITSSRILRAFAGIVAAGKVQISGVYDATQMAGVLKQWEQRDDLAWKIRAVQELITYGSLVGKHSTPYRPGHSHNFFHVKALVIDDLTLAGSHNFSHAAEVNAENVLTIASKDLAERTSAFAHRAAVRYR